MAKEKSQEQEQPVADQPAAEATATVPGASVSEVTTPVILRAKSREELDQQFQDMKAKYDGHTLTAGAVARSKDDGTYILRVDII
jgi:hypothetical protein